jgi:hypothetical protein
MCNGIRVYNEEFFPKLYGQKDIIEYMAGYKKLRDLNRPVSSRAKIFDNLNKMCVEKISLLTSLSPQISYPFYSKNIIDNHVTSPYPVGGLIGGNVTVLKKYIDMYWDFAQIVLDNELICTEEGIMKVVYDKMESNEIINLTFSAYASGEHDDYHFNMWDINSNNPKPLYMVWHEILNS